MQAPPAPPLRAMPVLAGDMKTTFLCALGGLLCGCADVAQLTYGRYLLEAERYAEAHPYLKEAAEIVQTDEAEATLQRCAAAWADELFTAAQHERTEGHKQDAFSLLRKAAGLSPSPKIVDALVTLEENLRTLCEGRAQLSRLCADKLWAEAQAIVQRLRKLEPYDRELYEIACHVHQEYMTECLRRARLLLEQGDFRGARDAIGRVSGTAGQPTGSIDVVDAEGSHCHELAWIIDRALETERQLALIDAALEAGELNEAFRLFEGARHRSPPVADLPLRLRRTEERIMTASNTAIGAAILSGDIRQSVTVLNQIRTCNLPVASDTLSQYEAQLKEQLLSRIAGHMAGGRAGNALLLMGMARESFPELAFEEEARVRRAFRRATPGITITGPGRDAVAAGLADVAFSSPGGGAAITVDVGEPSLTVAEAPPQYGFELREVPGALQKRVHPERLKLEQELKRAHELLSESFTPEDAWEAEAWRALKELRTLQWKTRKRQLDRLPAFTYIYQWKKERVKIAYLQLKAALVQILTISCPGVQDPEAVTLSANRSYGATLLPGEDPYAAGLFPSPENLRSELGKILRRKSLTHLRRILDRALTESIRRAVDLAGRGHADQAVDLLCRISGTRADGLKAPQEAEQLLRRTWSPEAVAYLLAPDDRTALADRNVEPKRER